MSVISKFVVRSVEDFGTGKLTHLSILCENDIMVAYNPDHHDKLFTQYSPSGDMKLSQPQYVQLGSPGDYEFAQNADAFYVIMLNDDEGPAFDTPDRVFPGATLAFVGKCLKVEDYGDDNKQVVFTGTEKQSHRGMEKFRWQMQVNNPGAYSQFRPKHDVWIIFYPCNKFSFSEAVHAAHHDQGA